MLVLSVIQPNNCIPENLGDPLNEPMRLTGIGVVCVVLNLVTLINDHQNIHHFNRHQIC